MTRIVLAMFALAAAASADMVGHGGMIRSIAVSDDGRLVLTASFDYSVRLWRFDEQSQTRLLEGHDGPVNAAAFVPDRARAVTAGADGQVIVWDLDTGAAVAAFAGHVGQASSVVISRDGTQALSGGWDGRLALWDLTSAGKVAEFATDVPITAVAMVQNGGLLIAAGRDGRIRIVRRTDGITVAQIAAHELGLTQLAVSGDSSRAATIGLDNHARVWQLHDQTQLSDFLPDPEVKPVSAALSADGMSVLIGYLDGTVLHLDATTGTVKRQLKAEAGPVWAVAFTPDGRFALTAGVEERVKVWHLDTGDRISVGDNDDKRPMPWLTSDHPGARVYRKCANCHALAPGERQRSGPHFAGLFGRRAGTVPDYRYSEVLKQSTVVWSPETLTALFRDGPDHYMPGTKMPMQRIGNEAELKALIEYLQQIVPAE